MKLVLSILLMYALLNSYTGVYVGSVRVGMCNITLFICSALMLQWESQKVHFVCLLYVFVHNAKYRVKG